MAIDALPIIIAGCGPGADEYITPIARKKIEQADVLVCADHLHEIFSYLQVERIRVGTNLETVLKAIEKHRNWRIVVAVSGDPGISSLARLVIKRFGYKNCQVIPGISSVQVAFARIGLDWMDARIISAHGRIPEINKNELDGVEKIAVLAGGKEAARWVINLLDCLQTERIVYVCKDLTLENESVYCIKPSELEYLTVSSRTIFLLLPSTYLKTRG